MTGLPSRITSVINASMLVFNPPDGTEGSAKREIGKDASRKSMMRTLRPPFHLLDRFCPLTILYLRPKAWRSSTARSNEKSSALEVGVLDEQTLCRSQR